MLVANTISRCAKRGNHRYLFHGEVPFQLAYSSASASASEPTTTGHRSYFTSGTSNNASPRPMRLPQRRHRPLAHPPASITSRPLMSSSARRMVPTARPSRRFSIASKAKDPADGAKPDEKNTNAATLAATTPTERTKEFLVSTLGYSPSVSDGIIDALLQNGIPPSSLLGMVKGLAGRYEVGEDGGLEALATSVELELEKQHGKRKVRVRCLPSTGWDPAPNDDDDDAEGDDDAARRFPTIRSMDRAFEVEAVEGTTLTDVAKFGTSDNCDVLGEYLECACAGIMACSTCHVVIHPDWYDAEGVPAGDEEEEGEGDASPGNAKKIRPPSEAELDMIDLAYQPQVTSRLGCQIKLTKEMDGLVILLPKGSNNLMDFVPFE